MDQKLEYVYIMCPVPVEKLKDLSIPFLQSESPFSIPLAPDEDFVPLWYGNARFPEDEE